MILLDVIKQYKFVNINSSIIPIDKIICFEIYQDEVFVNYSTRENGKFRLKETSCKSKDVMLL